MEDKKLTSRNLSRDLDLILEKQKEYKTQFFFRSHRFSPCAMINFESEAI